MKRCELCDRSARMYCESDQASLCWECDAKVHGANFLVERHPRVLLCRRCQAQTPWRATGARLSPIISACERCTTIDKASPAGEEQDDDSRIVEEEQDDYQVVPWRLTPPPPGSSSSGEESSSPSTGRASSNFLKRVRESAVIGEENESTCPFHRRSRQDLSIQAPFSSQSVADEKATHASASCFCPSKDRRRAILQSDAQLSADSTSNESRVSTRRASAAADPVSSPSGSPPI
ncbi:uncharacterized protein LOC110022790 [Phalaenopsis equestris]|uniref:uncharacterized protein LOC110022790 n=1 Tax=Phalaenopsis equestris TaxID=78828 RepID=UPI0009E5EB8E|nr:uncharacterized protein LOC110022790 [Phalaenopsis equestris]